MYGGYLLHKEKVVQRSEVCVLKVLFFYFIKKPSHTITPEDENTC